MDVASLLNNGSDLQTQTLPEGQNDNAADKDFTSVYTSEDLPYAPSNFRVAKLSLTSSFSSQGLHERRTETTEMEQTPIIKSEVDEQPSEMPVDGTAPANMDDATLAAILQAQSEHGTRVRKPVKKALDGQEASRISPPPPTPKAMSRKRPISTKPVPTGAKKTLFKRRKMNQRDDTSSKRSETPASRASKATTSKRGRKMSQSMTPRSDSPAVNSPAEEDVDLTPDSDMDDTLYCICRKPDNHTWMIGCDGECKDWFHGKCVNVDQADAGLIDKYICPNCAISEERVTTWKPMCRNGGCRKPARVRGKPPSKYCSDGCGIEFFTSKLSLTSHDAKALMASAKAAEAEVEDLPDLGSRGGAIRAEELKSLLEAVSDAQEFRRLGSVELLTPPASAPPETEDIKMEDAQADSIFSAEEEARLQEIAARKSMLRERRALLKDREHFVTMTKERASQAAIDAKVKDQCGFDDRLSWDDKTFAAWRNSTEGKESFSHGALDPAEVTGVASKAGFEPSQSTDDDNTLKPRPHSAAKRNSVEDQHICTKKRCTRHGGWQKLALQDVRFEEADVGDEMRRIDKEETSIKTGATIKKRLQTGNADDHDDGTVEVVR